MIRRPDSPPAARPRARHSLLLLAAVLLTVLTACSTSSSSSKGPDLTEQMDALPSLTKATTPPEGLDLEGADGTYVSAGTEAEVANVISAGLRPDERSDSANGDTFLLYPQGTVWITPSGDQTAVVVYEDNDRAYRRHSGVLLASAGWGNRMRNYDSGGGSNGSSTGNGFRGGGSGSGK